MNGDVSANLGQPALLAQVRASLRRYAFIFAAIGAVFTCGNVFVQEYVRSVDRATLVSRDPALIQTQLYLRKSSLGGKDYDTKLKDNEEFMLSLIVLMNYYETTAQMIESWSLMGWVVRDHLKCPLGKHVRIFLLGESRDGFWRTNGAFLSRDQFPSTMRLFEVTKAHDKVCEAVWRPIA